MTKIIDAAKQGTLIVYSDNDGENFDPHMERTIAARADLKQLNRTSYTHMLIGNDEESSVLADYATWLGGRKSKLTGHATTATFVKL